MSSLKPSITDRFLNLTEQLNQTSSMFSPKLKQNNANLVSQGKTYRLQSFAHRSEPRKHSSLQRVCHSSVKDFGVEGLRQRVHDGSECDKLKCECVGISNVTKC